MRDLILVTGGAGFVGSHLVDALIRAGYQVRVYDCLVPQVHGNSGIPRNLHPEAEFIQGDLRNKELLRRSLEGVRAIFHQAAEVGVGQSMYEIVRYVEANSTGTATLLELLADGGHSVEKLVVASSMSIYGEGSYSCSACGEVHPRLRPAIQLVARDWEMCCPLCSNPVEPLPTTEDKPLFPTSIYAITKMDTEFMALSIGQAYGIPTVALRYFNIYGPRQALSNPYTGVGAIFCSQLLNGRPPIVFEDGHQRRDFIHVSDIVRANIMALRSDAANGQAFSVGTGRATTILEVAHLLSKHLGVHIEPKIVGKFRAGDIRHCYANPSKARELLGFEATVSIEYGISDLVTWVRQQQPTDLLDLATSELERRGLTQ